MSPIDADAPAINAERVLMIRPFDDAARDALRWLAHETGARIRKGSVRLADGIARPALLAIQGGVTLAALLIEDDETSSPAPDTRPETSRTATNNTWRNTHHD